MPLPLPPPLLLLPPQVAEAPAALAALALAFALAFAFAALALAFAAAALAIAAFAHGVGEEDVVCAAVEGAEPTRELFAARDEVFLVGGLRLLVAGSPARRAAVAPLGLLEVRLLGFASARRRARRGCAGAACRCRGGVVPAKAAR